MCASTLSLHVFFTALIPARLVLEVVAVAAAYGVSIRPAYVDEAMARFRMFRDANPYAKSSMLVDIEHGRPTEVDWLHGTLVRLAAAKGVDIPVCATVYAVIRISISAPTAAPAAPATASDAKAAEDAAAEASNL